MPVQMIITTYAARHKNNIIMKITETNLGNSALITGLDAARNLIVGHSQLHSCEDEGVGGADSWQ